MSKQCIGCGISLQDNNTLLEGYTSSLENDICSRCFRLINYGDYQVVTKSNDDYLEILKKVGESKDLVLYIVDILNLPKDLMAIKKLINNRMILVLNKRDALPKSINDDKLIERIKSWGVDYQDIIITSAHNNYNLDELMRLIKKEKSSRNVYVVGNTNVGKSALIDKMIKNYSDLKSSLTISPFPSTTIDKISIKLNDDLTLIDTPGLIEDGNISNYLDLKEIKKLIPKKEIKAKTYQLKEGQSLVIGDFLRIDYREGEKNSFTLFLSNDIKVKRHNIKNKKLLDLAKRSISVDYYEDLVISGLGFIKIVKKGELDIYSNINVKLYTRSSLI